MAYTDDITITSTHTQVRVQPRNTCNHTFCLDKTKQPLTKSRQNNLHSVHTRPCIIYEQYGPNNKQQSTTHGNPPKGSGSYLRPKTHIQHTHPHHLITSTHTSTNHKSTHCNMMGYTEGDTYKGVMRPALEYASSVWSPIAFSTSINKLQAMQNATLKTATGCTQDTNIQHLHDENSHSPYPSTYRSTPYNTNRKHNILQPSKSKTHCF